MFQVNALMRVYAHANMPDKMLNLFRDMGQGIVPDKVTYTTLFRYYPEDKDTTFLRSVWKDIEERLECKPDSSSTPVQTSPSLLAQKAAQITKSEEVLRVQQLGQKLEVDDSLIAALMFAVAKSAKEKDDLLFGIQLIARLYGDCPPLAERMLEKREFCVPTQRYDLKLSSKVLDAIMRSFSAMGSDRLADAYFEHATRQYRYIDQDEQLLRTHAWIKRRVIDGYKSSRKHQSMRQ